MSFYIAGTGSALPEKVVTNDDLAKFLDTSDEWIRTRTGISRRHVLTTERLQDLAIRSAKIAMEEAGVSPKMKQYLMGHASLEMTQNVYTDVQPEYIKENAGRILSAFDNCLTTKTTENALGTH